MATDDNETRGRTPSGRWLSLVPVTIAVVLLALMMPHATAPEDVPLPRIDPRALAAATNDDIQRASRARQPDQRLRDDVLAVGTALRAYQKAQTDGSTTDAITEAKLRLDNALGLLLGRDADRAAAYDLLRSLRAVQLEQFLSAVKDFEATGKPTDELAELGGTFIDRMRSAGWMEGNRLVLDDAQRRAAFKTVWTALLFGQFSSPLDLTLDEQRALYGLYLLRPHPPEMNRKGFEIRRASAATPGECAKIELEESLAAEMWRADKVRRLGEIDPSYPTNYALGVSLYKAGHYEESAQAFQRWLEVHPEGPWTLRARNHLKAALVAQGP